MQLDIGPSLHQRDNVASERLLILNRVGQHHLQFRHDASKPHRPPLWGIPVRRARVYAHAMTDPTPETEESLRRALGAKDVDDDPTASVHAIQGRPPVSSNRDAAPANPYANALAAIWVISLIVGIVLLVVGISNASSYDPSEFSEHTDNGVTEMVFGGIFVGLGITAAMVHLGVAAILHRLDRA